MKHLFAKWLAVLLIAALLLTPVAMMEEAPAAEPVAPEIVNADETPAEPDAAPEDDAAPAEPDETPDEPDETPDEPDETEEEADELIVAEAFEADVADAEDVDLAEADPADQEIEYDLADAEISSEAVNAGFDADGNVTTLFKDDFDPVVWEYLREARMDYGEIQYGEHYDRNKDNKLDAQEMQQIYGLFLGKPMKWENNGWSFEDLGVQSLKGLDLLPNLSSLYVNGNKQLGPTLDVSAFKSLTNLTCQGCGLTKIEFGTNTKWNGISCGFNSLGTLNVSQLTGLRELMCYNCDLTELTLGSLNNLQNLQCNNNDLQTLDISECPLLLSIATDNYKQVSGFYQKEEQTAEGWTKWYMLQYDGNKTTLLLANGQSIAPEPMNGGGQGGQGLSIELNSTNFPDPALLAALKAFDDDNNDILSMAENEKVTALDLSGTSFSDPTGMENLHWLKELNVSGCASLTDLSITEYNTDGSFKRSIWPGNIEKLNASNCTNLKTLQYGESNLSELNVTGCTNLEELGCNFDRNLTSLDVSTCKNLKRLYIGWTKLTAVPKLANNDLLEELNCSELGLTALNPGDYPNLNILSCGGNGLSQLDISGCATLTTLDCWGNTFSELNLSNNKKLAELWCEGNPNLKTLDISNCEVLNAAVDPSAPKEIDYNDDGNPDCLGYGPYVDEYNYNGWRLTCDKGVTIIKKKAEDPTPPPANVSQPSSGTAASNEPQITIAKTPKSTKAKAGKKGRVTVTWKKIKKTKKTKALLGQIKSVQVQYSTDPNFAANVVTKSVSKKKTKVTLKLQKKTTYYIRVRYVGTDGVSNWGAVKKVRTKK